MKISRTLALQIAGLSFLLIVAANAFAVKAPTKPLEQRIRAADTIFVGEVLNRNVDGDWVRAELLVVEPLHNAVQSRTVTVIWRATLDGRPIYDKAENSQGIAILKHKHNGRYWLRSDKFEPLHKLDEVKQLTAAGRRR